MRARLRTALLRPARCWVPRRTVRMRLTALYGFLFLVAGALLLTITYLLVTHTSSGTATVSVNSKGGQVNAMVVFGTAPPVVPPGVRRQAFQGSNGGVSVAVPPKLSPDRLRLQLQNVLNQQHAHERHQLLLWSGTALGIMALVSVALGWLMAGRVLAPLRTMTARARQISADNLDARLALTGPEDELKDLGDTIDGLLARLEQAFEAQRLFVANASHELRTPLTLERAMIEVALADPDATIASLRDVCARVLAAGEEQERLIDALLTLARGQRGLERRETVNLADVVAEQLDDVHPVPQVTSALDGAPVVGDRRLLTRLVGNLLENAVRHNVEPGWVRIATAAHNGRATLQIANSGPRVADEEVAALLEPFRRALPERSSHGPGHGLGLSIGAAIATAHGAELDVRARPAGGLDVVVRFPLAGAQSRADREPQPVTQAG